MGKNNKALHLFSQLFLNAEDGGHQELSPKWHKSSHWQEFYKGKCQEAPLWVGCMAWWLWLITIILHYMIVETSQVTDLNKPIFEDSKFDTTLYKSVLKVYMVFNVSCS